MYAWHMQSLITIHPISPCITRGNTFNLHNGYFYCTSSLNLGSFPVWCKNRLPVSVIKCTSFQIFKSRLDSHLLELHCAITHMSHQYGHVLKGHYHAHYDLPCRIVSCFDRSVWYYSSSIPISFDTLSIHFFANVHKIWLALFFSIAHMPSILFLRSDHGNSPDKAQEGSQAEKIAVLQQAVSRNLRPSTNWVIPNYRSKSPFITLKGTVTLFQLFSILHRTEWLILIIFLL